MYVYLVRIWCVEMFRGKCSYNIDWAIHIVSNKVVST